MDRVFLDANVLFSSAYSPESRFVRLWQLIGIQLLTSSYAVDEARRNLPNDDQRQRLDRLLSTVEISEVPLDPNVVEDVLRDVTLPEKNLPVLAAAITAGATHLLTGDVRHFGPYFGKTVRGVQIERPGYYIDERERDGTTDG